MLACVYILFVICRCVNVDVIYVYVIYVDVYTCVDVPVYSTCM